MFVQRPLSAPGEVDVIHPSAYYFNRLLSDQFRTNALIIPRSSLIGSQALLNAARNLYLAPQIRAAEFNATPWRMNTNFWIGNVKNGVQAIAPFIPLIP